MSYKRLSLYLSGRQARHVKRLAYLDSWETADLPRVLITLGIREEFTIDG